MSKIYGKKATQHIPSCVAFGFLIHFSSHMDETPVKGTIIRRTIRGKERFYHQWREDGVTKSRYLKAEEVLPLRERLEREKTGSVPIRSGSAPVVRLFTSGVIAGARLKELTADIRRLKPREILADALSWMGSVPVFSLVGAPRSGKTTLLKELILSLSDDILPVCAYLSIPAALTAPEFLADLETLFSRGIRRFFIDGIDRADSLPGTVPVLEDIYVARGASFVLTAVSADALSSFPVLDTSRISFKDFCTMSGKDELEAYLEFRGLAEILSSAPPPSPHLGAAARKRAHEKLRRECAEKLLKDLVLEETRLRRSSATIEVFAPTLPSGGVDMIVVDHEELTCELYEVRYALERDDKQIAHLENSRNLDHLEHLYGMITAREVLYLGRNAWHHAGVFYRNVSTYLKGGLT